jgi:hypothetical protein
VDVAIRFTVQSLCTAKIAKRPLAIIITPFARLRSEHRVERSHHPKRHIFTLLDVPVPLDDYQMAVTRDCEAGGYFLDRVIIVKVIGNKLWRFSSMDRPYKLEGFDKMSKEEIILTSARLAQSLADCFGIQESKIAAALSYVQLV